jgi:hypothetical protein
MRAALCLLVLVSVPLDARQRAAVLTADEYVAALDATRDLVAALTPDRRADVDNIVAALPSAWVVNAANHTYRVPTSWLLVELNRWREQPDTTVLGDIVRGLEARRRGAVSLTREPRDLARERTDLAQILASKEFQGVHGPTWFEELRAGAMALLVRWLGGILRSSAIPTLTRVAVYGLAALAILVVGVALFRVLRTFEAAPLQSLHPDALPASRSWRQWRDDADAAAASGQWREAIHFAYWSAIAFLETEGAWRPDATRTPREYVRLLPDSASSRAPLTTLTRLLEHVWYGTQPASAADFERAQVSLEELGCPSR